MKYIKLFENFGKIDKRKFRMMENLTTDLNKLKGKTIKKVEYDPYVGTFMLFFTDRTSVELGSSGFSNSGGDELYVNFD